MHQKHTWRWYSFAADFLFVNNISAEEGIVSSKVKLITNSSSECETDYKSSEKGKRFKDTFYSSRTIPFCLSVFIWYEIETVAVRVKCGLKWMSLRKKSIAHQIQKQHSFTFTFFVSFEYHLFKYRRSTAILNYFSLNWKPMTTEAGLQNKQQYEV